MPAETLDASRVPPSDDADRPPHTGALLVFGSGRAMLRAIEVGETPITLGRGTGPDEIDDARMSRKHVELTWQRGALVARDLGSRNGTQVDGASITRATVVSRVLRVGDALLVPHSDITPFERLSVRLDDETVVGPTLAAAHAELASIARAGDVVFVCGETGSGKELAARIFHAHTKEPGPFIAVNCATIPVQLAERLLFGAKKGAFSGADADAAGLVQAADGGTLFLDEVAELPLEVQSKLLRVLEAREVVAVGATQPRAVRFRLCSAGHEDLRALVAAKRFREDLYFRIGRPRVVIPPLRDRPEEMPWLVQSILARRDRVAHVSLVEAVLARPWPGNVRELVVEIGDAMRRAEAGPVKSSHLDAESGMPFEPATTSQATDRDAIEGAIVRANGNISEAARALGVHRTQLRRWIAQFDIDLARFR